MGRPLRAEEVRVVPVSEKRDHCGEDGCKGDEHLSNVGAHDVLPPLCFYVSRSQVLSHKQHDSSLRSLLVVYHFSLSGSNLISTAENGGFFRHLPLFLEPVLEMGEGPHV